MDNFSSKDFRELANARGAFRVSIYMPTHVGSPEEFQDTVRLKTLLDQAERQLAQTGMTPQETKHFLAATRKLPEQATIWHDRDQGLALFIDQDGLKTLRLPIKFKERVAVSDRFVTRYLLPLIVHDRAFMLLALGRQHVKLYRGTHYSLEEVPVAKMPADMAQALSIESADRGVQLHSMRPVRAGRQASTFHGQGGQRDADQKQFREFMHAINAALAPILAKSNEPLVLACVGYEAAEFKAVCRYPQLLDIVVTGDPSKWSKRDLHEKAWNIVAETIASDEAALNSRYQQQLGTGTTSNQIDEIVLAAHAGDLETLMVDPHVQAWGYFDPASERLILHDAYNAMDHDLVDQVILQTYLAKGTVRMLAAEKIPSTSGLAAIYRHGRVPRSPRVVGDENRQTEPV